MTGELLTERCVGQVTEEIVADSATRKAPLVRAIKLEPTRDNRTSRAPVWEI